MSRPREDAPLRAGEAIAWRNCVRDETGRPAPSFAIGMRVLQDTPRELVLYRGNGYPMRLRDSERATVAGFRHQPVLRFGTGWVREMKWHTHDVVVTMDPAGRHATSSFRLVATGELQFWYIDLIGPVTRRGHVLDFRENGLDVVVEPDLSQWRFKDADELEWNVSHGVYSRVEADELYAEGERAVRELKDELPRFASWLTWRPDAAWGPPQLPPGWDAID